MEKLVLASQSPRRCELLNRTCIPFETDAPDVDESCDLPAGEAVRILSLRKAHAAAKVHPGRFILAADTLVSYQDAALGKPADEQEAVRMLHMLSGNTHQVYTAVTVISPDGTVYTDADRTDRGSAEPRLEPCRRILYAEAFLRKENWPYHEICHIPRKF